MDTTTPAITENTYKAKNGRISYDRSVEHKISITAEEPCILRFPMPNPLNREFLVLETGKTQTFDLPESFRPIYFDVYLGSETLKYGSEPPPIRP